MIGSLSGFTLGGTVKLRADSGEITDTLQTDSFTIVGIVDSPYYISFERGNTSIGSGEIDAFMMIPSDDFIMEAYAEVYIKAEGTQDVSEYSERYEELVTHVKDNLDAISDSQAKARYTQVLTQAQAELIDAKKEVADARKQLDDAEKKIADGEKELAENEDALREKELEFNEQMASAWQKINKGQGELTAGEREYNKQYQAYVDAKAQLEAGKAELEEKQALLDDAMRQLDEAKKQLDDAQKQLNAAQTAFNIAKLMADEAEKNMAAIEEYINKYAGNTVGEALDKISETNPQLAERIRGVLEEYGVSEDISAAQGFNYFKEHFEELKQQLEQLGQQLEASKQQLEDGTREWEEKKAQADDGQRQADEAKVLLAENEAVLLQAGEELIKAQAQLSESSKLLAQNRKQLESAENSGREQLDDAGKQLSDAKTELSDARAELAEKKLEAEEKLEDARKQIADGEKQLSELSVPTWYIMDRDSIPGHAEYGDNTQRIAAIASVFPVFFFVVAAPVCLTTMTRMVEEDRTQIGVLKALGYGKGKIVSKYLIYAFLAGAGGGAFGLAVGFKLFPSVIVNAYKIMYKLPVETVAVFQLKYAVVGMAAAIACTVLAAVGSCYKELRANPATLMRPKAPKSGKRILLERITFIWKHLKFTQKVTARNIFRYKKRFFMTVFGIGGCTALLLTGFGIKYAVAGMSDKQFGELSDYDIQIILNDGVTPENRAEKLDFIDADERISASLLASSKSCSAGTADSKMDVTLFVPENIKNFSDMIFLRSRKGHEAYSLTDSGAVISEKFASKVGLKVGDNVYIRREDGGKEYTVPVSAITENYINHYVYISPALYAQIFDGEPEYTNLFVQLTPQAIQNGEDEIAEDLLTHDEILGFAFLDAMRSKLADIMKSLDSVIVILIISAGALAFVVLYNLTNININERVREIATIKVLGFFDKEVSAYIYRENVLLTVFGIIFGLMFGGAPENFVITTAEVEMVMFLRDINFMSFVYSALLTVLFSGIVNVVMHFHLKKIKMVESLKSVE